MNAKRSAPTMPLLSRHIMICRTDNIGDVMLTLPITAWLKQHVPGIQISFLCRAYAAGAVRACTSVDEVVELEQFLRDPAAFFAQADIDTIIFAQPDRTLVMAAFKARIANRIGNARQKVYQLLFCNRRVRFSKRDTDLHEAQINFEFLRPFGLTEIPSLETIARFYDFRRLDSARVDALVAAHPFNLILHPKSNGHGREWPIAHYRELAAQLSAHAGIHIWITGSRNEGTWLAEHAAALLALPNVTNVCGSFDLEEFSAFIQAADGLVASGTGPLHLAAALRQHALGLFPPTRPMHPGRWAPVGAQAQFLCQPTSCAGCRERTTPSCDCMEAITPASVCRVVLEWHEQKCVAAAALPQMAAGA